MYLVNEEKKNREETECKCNKNCLISSEHRFNKKKSHTVCGVW